AVRTPPLRRNNGGRSDRQHSQSPTGTAAPATRRHPGASRTHRVEMPSKKSRVALRLRSGASTRSGKATKGSRDRTLPCRSSGTPDGSGADRRYRQLLRLAVLSTPFGYALVGKDSGSGNHQPPAARSRAGSPPLIPQSRTDRARLETAVQVRRGRRRTPHKICNDASRREGLCVRLYGG